MQLIVVEPRPQRCSSTQDHGRRFTTASVRMQCGSGHHSRFPVRLVSLLYVFRSGDSAASIRHVNLETRRIPIGLLATVVSPKPGWCSLLLGLRGWLSALPTRAHSHLVGAQFARSEVHTLPWERLSAIFKTKIAPDGRCRNGPAGLKEEQAGPASVRGGAARSRLTLPPVDHEAGRPAPPPRDSDSPADVVGHRFHPQKRRRLSPETKGVGYSNPESLLGSHLCSCPLDEPSHALHGTVALVGGSSFALGASVGEIALRPACSTR